MTKIILKKKDMEFLLAQRGKTIDHLKAQEENLRDEVKRLREEVATLTRCGADMSEGLGRLTKERDDLLAAARDVLLGAHTPEEDPHEMLRSAVAACEKKAK